MQECLQMIISRAVYLIAEEERTMPQIEEFTFSLKFEIALALAVQTEIERCLLITNFAHNWQIVEIHFADDGEACTVRLIKKLAKS